MNEEIMRSLFFLLLVPLGIVTAVAIPMAKTKFFEKIRNTIDRWNSWAGYLVKCVYCLSGWSSLAVTAFYNFPFLDWLFKRHYGLKLFSFDFILLFEFILRWGVIWGISIMYYRLIWPFLEKTAPKWRIQHAKSPLPKSRISHPESYDVAIVGGGVTGAAQAYVFSRFMNGVSKILLLEKNKDVALVNSNTDSNAQTLHGGDTETNFGLEKALKMRDAEHMLTSFLEKHGSGAFRRLYKMAFGVGEREVKLLKERFSMIAPYYPTLRFLGRDELAKIEPKLLEGRNSKVPVAALFRPNGCAVDYRKLAESFVAEAKKSGKIEILLGTRTRRIARKDGLYEIRTNNGIFKAKTVMVAAGPYSLLFAHNLGYASDYTILPVAGNFYRTKSVKFDGKVYTVQDPMFPFAAAHMDSSVEDPSVMRIGPTADIVPFLERHQWRTFVDFLRVGIISRAGLRAILKIFWSIKVLRFAARNVIYKIPVVGKWYFLKKAVQKIVPTLRYRDIEFAKGEGGIRPQLVNVKEGRLEMGTGKILGDNIIFDITPSPGASDCLRNAVVNAEHCARFLGDEFTFDKENFEKEFLSS